MGTMVGVGFILESCALVGIRKKKKIRHVGVETARVPGRTFSC